VSYFGNPRIRLAIGGADLKGAQLSVILVLLALSAVIGVVLAKWFSWFGIAASSCGLALLSSIVLHLQDFGALLGMAIIVTCLIVHQIAYLAGVYAWRPPGSDSGDRPDSDIAGRSFSCPYLRL
jgi:hypothetical protein